MAFSPEDIEVTLNGHVIQGWSDDTDFFMPPETKAHTRTRIGADGRRLRVSDPGKRGGPVAVKIMPDSPSVPFMQRFVENSKNGMIENVEGSAIDRRNGATLAMEGGVLMEGPDWWTFGAGDVKNMVYTFDFTDLKGNFDGVVFN